MFARVVTLPVRPKSVVTWLDVIAPDRKFLAPAAVKVPKMVRPIAVLLNTWPTVVALPAGIGGCQCA